MEAEIRNNFKRIFAIPLNLRSFGADQLSLVEVVPLLCVHPRVVKFFVWKHRGQNKKYRNQKFSLDTFSFMEAVFRHQLLNRAGR